MTETVLSDGPVSKTGWLSRREPTGAGPASPAPQRAELRSSSEHTCVHAEIAHHGTRLLRHKGPQYNALSTPIHELTNEAPRVEGEQDLRALLASGGQAVAQAHW